MLSSISRSLCNSNCRVETLFQIKIFFLNFFGFSLYLKQKYSKQLGFDLLNANFFNFNVQGTNRFTTYARRSVFFSPHDHQISRSPSGDQSLRRGMPSSEIIFIQCFSGDIFPRTSSQRVNRSYHPRELLGIYIPRREF